MPSLLAKRAVAGRILLATLIIISAVCPLRAETTEESGSILRELEHIALRAKEAEKAVEKRLLSESLRLHFYGYLDASYTQNFNNPSNRINELRIFDVNSNQSRFNLAQFVLRRDAQAGSDWLDRVGFKIKFNAGRDSAFIGGNNIGPWTDFQEYYLQYLAPVGGGLDLKLGQINSIVGYEVVESRHNANYSRSWLFGLGQPFTTRGVRATYELDKRTSLSVGVIEYINSARASTSHDPLVETALTLAPSDRVKLTLYGLAGPRSGASGTDGGTILLAGGFASFHLTDQLSAVLESYYANQPNSSTISQAKNARWDGVAAYLLYDVNQQWGARLRGEVFEDAGGFVSCGGTTAYQPRANVCFGASSVASAPSVAQTLWEFTGTLQYKPLPSLTTRLEYRYDKSSQNVFQVGGRATSYQPTLSFEAIYAF